MVFVHVGSRAGRVVNMLNPSSLISIDRDRLL
jgi:hypothetical protein